jgi:hypothetical protein
MARATTSISSSSSISSPAARLSVHSWISSPRPCRKEYVDLSDRASAACHSAQIVNDHALLIERARVWKLLDSDQSALDDYHRALELAPHDFQNAFGVDQGAGDYGLRRQ